MAEHGRGRAALLDAAAALMDERGIDNVSLSQINRASGHRNRSAVHYHFGTRDAVVRELVRRTMDGIDAERNALLDHLETTGAALTERTVLEVIVGPLTRQLRTAEGRRYLRLAAQLITHPRFVSDLQQIMSVNSSARRCARHLAPALARLPAQVAAERASQMVGFLVRTCADQARLLDASPPPRPPLCIEAFTANLVDVLLAMLTAPTTVRADPPHGSPPGAHDGHAHDGHAHESHATHDGHAQAAGEAAGGGGRARAKPGAVTALRSPGRGAGRTRSRTGP
jgi:AcrR family transcriptional regulator